MFDIPDRLRGRENEMMRVYEQSAARITGSSQPPAELAPP